MLKPNPLLVGVFQTPAEVSVQDPESQVVSTIVSPLALVNLLTSKALTEYPFPGVVTVSVWFAVENVLAVREPRSIARDEMEKEKS